MMHHKTKTNILLSVLLFVAVFAPLSHSFVQASTDTTKYDVLIPLPTKTGSESSVDTTDPIKYINTLYRLLISLAVVVAVLMIVLGGVQYMTAGDNPGKVSSAKERITQALLGLLILASSFIILNTINPKLLDFTSIFTGKIAAPAGSGTPPVETPGGGTPPTETPEEPALSCFEYTNTPGGSPVSFCGPEEACNNIFNQTVNDPNQQVIAPCHPK